MLLIYMLPKCMYSIHQAAHAEAITTSLYQLSSFAISGCRANLVSYMEQGIVIGLKCSQTTSHQRHLIKQQVASAITLPMMACISYCIPKLPRIWYHLAFASSSEKRLGSRFLVFKYRTPHSPNSYYSSHLNHSRGQPHGNPVIIPQIDCCRTCIQHLIDAAESSCRLQCCIQFHREQLSILRLQVCSF